MGARRYRIWVIQGTYMYLDVFRKTSCLVGEGGTAVRAETACYTSIFELCGLSYREYEVVILYTKPVGHDGASHSATALTMAISGPNGFTFDLILNIPT